MIITKSRKILVAVLMASSLTLPLYSQSLGDLLAKAQSESNTAVALALSKEQSLLTLDMNDLSREKTYSINPLITANFPTYATDPIYDREDSSYTVGGTDGKLIAFNFPGSKHIANSQPIYDDTNLYIDVTSTIYYDESLSLLYYGLKPGVGFDHTFLFGEYDTLREDATELMNLITIDQSYKSGMIDYKKTVLNMVKNLIINDQNQVKLKNSIEDAQVSIKNNLDLQLYNKTTIGYKADMITLNSLKNTLDNAKTQRVQLESRFKDYTGFLYKGVNSIELPNLDIAPSQEDSLTVQMAKLQLQLVQNTVDEIEKDKDRSSLFISGNDTLTIKSDDSTLENSSTVILNYTADNFSILGAASLATTYNDAEWTNTPTFSLGGSWTSDSTKEYDVIESKKNANELIAAQSNLSSTLSEYSYKKTNLKSNIDSWNFTYSQLEDNMEIAGENNNLIQQMFDLGLKSQTELNKSNIDFDQMKYDELTTLIDGWLVKFEIEALNL